MKKVFLLMFLLGFGVTLCGCGNQTGDSVTPTKGPTATVGPETDNSSTTTIASTKEATEITPELTQAATTYEEAKSDGTLLSTGSRVSVHDPSIVYEPVTGKYYIFGSHKAWAVSDDLADWTTFTTNVSSDFSSIFAKSGEWSAKGSSNYNISGNLWAPDVIYNKTLEKWCMYMSVNGNNYYSSIAMATADSIEGPYTFEGTTVYSGFTNAEEAAMTDYSQVTGTNEVDSKYLTTVGKWNSSYGLNAIDPCVFYDADGQLWMSYGSWFGGIYLIKLDNTTGLRDYTYTYETVKDVSDQYLGIRISGGYGCTGEGSYIVWDQEAGYYYLYLSYCGLDATDNFSGYHIRMFRSENVTGPYIDAAGNNAICTKSGESQKNKGVKLFGNYYFSSLDDASGSSNANKGYMSGGHNSALIDSDGANYLIYHTRFNLGNEWHQIRVHQQFLNQDGWFVTAVYEYLGSMINQSGYAADEIVGKYELVNHGLAAATQFTGMLDTLTVLLNDDGTVTGDVTGTWEQTTGTDGKGYYANFLIDGIAYNGVFFKQFSETKTHEEVMTFTLIGSDNTSVWGSKMNDNITTEAESIVTVEDTSSSKYETLTGLLAYYSFNDSLKAGFDSSTGTSNNASVYGAAIASDSIRGAVLSFDGDNDYIKLPADVTTESEDFTFMAWVNANTVAMWARVFDFGDDKNNSLFTTVASDAGLRTAMKAASADEDKITADDTLQEGVWQHITVTLDGSTFEVTLYLDGVKIGTTTVDTTLNTFEGKANYIGKSQYDDPYFNGFMDDVCIFDHVLTNDEIIEYMQY